MKTSPFSVTGVFVLASLGTSNSVFGQNNGTDDEVIGGQGNETCLGSAGYVLCPETDECIRPWLKDCPFEGGEDFTGPMTISCTEGSRCNSYDNCTVSDGSATFGGYLSDLEGTYEILDNCTINCEGCTSGDNGNDDEIIGGQGNETCLASAGYILCPDTGDCIRPWMTNCPFEGGEDFMGPVVLTCSEGARCNLYDNCTVGNASSAVTITGYIYDLSGNYEIPENCTINCEGCSPEILGGDGNETCLGSAGYIICPDTGDCIRPWEETCPFEGGEDFTGPGTMTCEGGRCNAYDNCTISDGSATFSGYFSDLNGTYELADNCTVNCEGCACVNCNGTCLESAGYTLCPETDECIQPWLETCPFKGGEAFIGPGEMTCGAGSRCNAESNCTLNSGNETLGSGYFSDIEGTYGVSESCTVYCKGCTCEDCIDETEAACGEIDGCQWCPSTGEWFRPWLESCPTLDVVNDDDALPASASPSKEFSFGFVFGVAAIVLKSGM